MGGMGKIKPGIIRAAGPSGPKWTALRRRLFSPDMWGTAPLCYHCGHPIRSPGWQFGEVQHLLSPRTHPQLAWTVANMRPVHASDYSRSGGVNKRCPACDLACQAVAAGNLAPRDADGRPLPFPPAFTAARMADRQRYLAGGKVPRSARESGKVPGTPAAEPRTFPQAGRPF
jgi:hypothetical protein